MRAVGIILAGGNNNSMRELHIREQCSNADCRKYRAIDFALSNMTNSHIQKSCSSDTVQCPFAE